MSILKVKDENGNWINVPAIVGEKGEKGDKGDKGDNGEPTTLAGLGITASASELNKLDGVTATTKEINYLDGVTSNIQNQFAGKASRAEMQSYVAEQIAEAQLSGGEVDLSAYAKKDDLSAYAKTEDVPTKTSQLTNDSNFVTVGVVSGQLDKVKSDANQYTDDQISEHDHDGRYYTEAEIDAKLANISGGGSAGMVREFDSGEIDAVSFSHEGTLSKFYTILIATSSGVLCPLVVDYLHFKQYDGDTGATEFYIGGTSETLAAWRNGNAVHFAVHSPATSKIKRVCGYY